MAIFWDSAKHGTYVDPNRKLKKQNAEERRQINKEKSKAKKVSK
jgi:hypothetical protein